MLCDIGGMMSQGGHNSNQGLAWTLLVSDQTLDGLFGLRDSKVDVECHGVTERAW